MPIADLTAVRSTTTYDILARASIFRFLFWFGVNDYGKRADVSFIARQKFAAMETAESA